MPGRSVKTAAIISLALFVVCLVANPRFAAPETANERGKYRQAISSLEADANLLAQEILALDLKQKKALQQKGIIEKEMSRTREMRDEALDQYNKSLEAKKQSIKKIAPWLNFQYRHGYWSLIDIIIGSESMSDLANRSMMVSLILGQQVKSYREAEEACSDSLKKEERLMDALNLLDHQNKSLENQINEIKTLAELRVEYFEQLKRTSMDLAQKVEDLERKFLHTLNLIDFFTGAMAKFPWHHVEPDRITMNIGGISLEVSENKLNGSLQESGDERLRDLSVKLSPGMFALTGKDGNSSSTFTLGGTLVPTGQSSTVRLDPKSLSIDGIPVTGNVLGDLAGDTGFSLPLPDAMRLYKVSKIDIGDRKVVITLSF
ncbi:MAG: coiled-coil domain-containing protein [Bacillota bacterium]